MRIAVLPHLARSDAMEVAGKLVAGARARRLEVVADPESAEALGIDGSQPVEGFDAVVAVGGDGTVLSAVQIALAADVPVLGVNLGTIGFLADAEPDELDTALDVLASGSWNLAERMTLHAAGPGGESVGVNDVVVEKLDSQRLVSLAVAFDREPFLTYRADGLVFATPTGSTAYNFSAGGPLVDPSLAAIVLTPVAPHSLFPRSVLLDPDVTIQCTVAQDRHVQVSVDGRVLGELVPGEVLEIRRGDRPARFIQVSGRSFPGLVKAKFRLGRL